MLFHQKNPSMQVHASITDAPRAEVLLPGHDTTASAPAQ
jgi:hypothetical protein